MTETEMLSEQDIADIEARANNRPLFNAETYAFDLRRLCQTVRALRDELKVADDALENQSQWLSDLRAENTALRERLAQVEKERLTDDERKVLADYHYYESEKAITRYGDKVGQRLHLERLAIVRARDKS